MRDHPPYALVAVALTARQRMALLAQRRRDDRSDDDPLFRAWHYLIPPPLQAQLSVGQLLWVPFGSELTQGILIGFAEEAPVDRLRPISAISELTPYLPPHGVPLAQWISHHYLAPLWDTLLLMLPRGVLQRSERYLFRSPRPVAQPLSRDGRRLLAWLEANGGQSTMATAAEAIGSKQRAQSVVVELLREGLLYERFVTQKPMMRPRMVDFVRLRDDAEREERLRALGRGSKQADLLALLAAAEGEMTLDALLASSGSSEATVREMVENRLLLWQAGTFVQRQWPAEQPPLSEAMQQALDWIDSWPESEPLPHPILRDHGIGNRTVEALLARGLLRLVSTAPDRIALALPRYRVNAMIDALRGTTKYRAALRFLQRQAVEMTWHELRDATSLSRGQLARMVEAGLLTLEAREVKRNPLAERHIPPTTPPKLTPEQRAVWRELRPALHRQQGESYLLHGVTGSGKTEIYLRAVAETLALGKQAIVLVPEIALTPQTVARFGGRFGDQIALQHSQLSDGERYDEWRRLRDGEATVAIGSRSAIFAPLPHVGLIVIDEEHEWSYKQGHLPGYSFPHYHARDVAEQIAAQTGALLLLGSATPALESYYRADRGPYRLLEMGERVARQLAPEDERAPGLSPVTVVDMRQELREGNSTIFSRMLREALAEVLEAQQQAILFLNRRGAHSFVMCRDCGWVQQCERCYVPMSHHRSLDYLICHQCRSRAAQAAICPRCLSPRIKQFGLGTQQVEEVTQRLFPDARILRWDSDSTRKKGAHEKLLAQFAAGQADILVGTQMVAKGLDLPLVTLVGVISADTALHLPDFRAAERTFQLLTQVAGRAGRGPLGGRVVLQSYTPHHYAIQSASQHNYHAFYRHELAFRRQHAYPPFTTLIKLVYRASSPRAAEEAATEYAAQLRERLAQAGYAGVEIIGPTPSFFGKLHGRYRWQVVVRGPHADARALLRSHPPSIGWEIDVDPSSML